MVTLPYGPANNSRGVIQHSFRPFSNNISLVAGDFHRKSLRLSIGGEHYRLPSCWKCTFHVSVLEFEFRTCFELQQSIVYCGFETVIHRLIMEFGCNEK